VVKNADNSYKITSSDNTNAVGWIINTNSQDVVDQSNNLRVPVWNEILRQILQITTIG